MKQIGSGAQPAYPTSGGLGSQVVDGALPPRESADIASTSMVSSTPKVIDSMAMFGEYQKSVISSDEEYNTYQSSNLNKDRHSNGGLEFGKKKKAFESYRAKLEAEANAIVQNL